VRRSTSTSGSGCRGRFIRWFSRRRRLIGLCPLSCPVLSCVISSAGQGRPLSAASGGARGGGGVEPSPQPLAFVGADGRPLDPELEDSMQFYRDLRASIEELQAKILGNLGQEP
jgi:hypothetical protein